MSPPKVGEWLHQATVVLLLLALALANPVDQGNIRAKVAHNGLVHNDLTIHNGPLLVTRSENYSMLGPRADDEPVKCRKGDNPYADDDDEEKQVPEGDPKNIYRPPNEPLELPDDKDDYGEDRFPPLDDSSTTPKRHNELIGSLVKRLPTSLRRIRDKCYGEKSRHPLYV